MAPQTCNIPCEHLKLPVPQKLCSCLFCVTCLDAAQAVLQSKLTAAADVESYQCAVQVLMVVQQAIQALNTDSADGDKQAEVANAVAVCLCEHFRWERPVHNL